MSISDGAATTPTQMSSPEPQSRGESCATVEHRISENFCKIDAEVCFLSSDGVIFRIHQKYLDTCTEGFPPGSLPQPANRSEGLELAELTESSRTLDLLFQHIYPQQHPHLDEMDFNVIAEVAEAAEKYQVFSAMEVCRLLMKTSVMKHPLQVLAYAAKHGYTNLADQAATLTLSLHADDALAALPLRAFITWIRYREAWTTALRVYVRQYVRPDGITHTWSGESRYGTCTQWGSARNQVNQDMSDAEFSKFCDLMALRKLITDGCSICSKRLENLAVEISRVPRFSTFHIAS